MCWRFTERAAATRLVGGGFERVWWWIGDPGSWQAYRRPDRRRVKALASSVRLGQGARMCVCVCVCACVYVCVSVLCAVRCNILCARSGCFGALYYEAGRVFSVGVSCDKGRSPLGSHLHMLALALALAPLAPLAQALALVGNQGTRELRSRRRVGLGQAWAHGLAPAC